MAATSKENMIRMNLYMPKQYKEWLERKSVSTGVTMSSIIITALKTYMDQQDYIELMPKMIEVLEKIDKLENMSKEDLEGVKTLIEGSGLKK